MKPISITRQRGQIVPMFVISLITLVMLLGLVFNTGYQVNSKIKVQNAADAAVISQATAVARSLNVASMNNVALTQMFVLYTLQNTLVPEAVLGFETAMEKLAEYLADLPDQIELCAGSYGAGCGPMFYTLWKIYKLIDEVLAPYLRILDDLLKTSITGDMLSTLERMNKQLETSFARSSLVLSNDLRIKNQLLEMPVFITGKAFPQSGNSLTMNLPIEEMDRPNPIPESGVPESMYNALCASAIYGTNEGLGGLRLPLRNRENFETHGYEFKQGPYPIGAEQFQKMIDQPTSALENPPHDENVEDWAEFRTLIGYHWPLACIGRSIVGANVLGVGYPSKPNVRVYQIKEPRGVYIAGASKEDWSIVSFATHKASTGIFENTLTQFPNPVRANHAFAQAEVFNLYAYDLYTQDWQAKLVPMSMLGDKQYRDKIAGKIKKVSESLSTVLYKIDEKELEQINTH